MAFVSGMYARVHGSEGLTGVSVILLLTCISAKSKILFINSQKLEPLNINISKTKTKTVHYEIFGN